MLIKRISFPKKKIKNNNWTGNLTRFTLNYSNIAYKAETFFLLLYIWTISYSFNEFLYMFLVLQIDLGTNAVDFPAYILLYL